MTLEDLYNVCAVKHILLTIEYNPSLDKLDFIARRGDYYARQTVPCHNISEMSAVVDPMEIVRNLECMLDDQEEMYGEARNERSTDRGRHGYATGVTVVRSVSATGSTTRETDV